MAHERNHPTRVLILGSLWFSFDLSGASMSNLPTDERKMTAEEERLVRWMLEHGEPEAKPFLQQLELVRVTAWRCPCGCASINFVVEGHTAPSVGLHPIANFVFGDDGEESGIFVFEKGG